MSELKGVANFKRRTWDVKQYENTNKIEENAEAERKKLKKQKTAELEKEEFKHAPKGAAGPMGSSRAFLQKRKTKVDLDSEVGSTKVVKQDAVNNGAGFYCETCECQLKDSTSYIDHINGKKHQRKLGYSMRVERSSVTAVKSRLLEASKQKLSSAVAVKLSALEEHEKRQKEIHDQEEREKRDKKEMKKKKKLDKLKDKPKVEGEEEMLAMMGFSGFGTTKSI